MSKRKIVAAPVRKAVTVNAPQVHAFQVFTSRFNAWWPKNHHIGKTDMVEGVIEPRKGGRWYERDADGTECDWGVVKTWEPPSRLVLSWRINSKFVLDDSIASEVEVRFVAESAQRTRVELEHRIEAEDAEALRTAVDTPNGWTALLDIYREVAEGGQRA